MDKAKALAGALRRMYSWDELHRVALFGPLHSVLENIPERSTMLELSTAVANAAMEDGETLTWLLTKMLSDRPRRTAEIEALRCELVEVL